ncbi:hypothetical protein Sta7437_2324 [Stanieria cyanosphaera PCC 7437]|uniref:Uncharacterized protein n=1 Tax=Stanieria cyanosphaera (strain ATCC 29371 / PCC 7437) TaxID=111780 RepID=K9XUW2_STAC7|nr:hypothetical protein [Stanieria cyanosphaera]AFZ35866.1 hypothetical protein Sta7437_2324 [Stanieria cyanosphaera PCC 7437]
METLDHQIWQTILVNSTDHLLAWGTILAQRIDDPDILGKIQDSWHNFIESGQVWAMLIGVFFGYTFKGFTSF